MHISYLIAYSKYSNQEEFEWQATSFVFYFLEYLQFSQLLLDSLGKIYVFKEVC